VATLKEKLALFVVGSIAVASSAACTNGGSSKADDNDLTRDDVPGEVSDLGTSNPTAIAIACGDFAYVSSDSPRIGSEGKAKGHLIVPNADITVSISAEGERLVTTSDNGLTVGINTGLPRDKTSLEGTWNIPSGDAEFYFAHGQQSTSDTLGSIVPDVTINASNTTLNASAFSEGLNVPAASVYAYRPNLDEVFGDVTTLLDAGVAHVGFEGNLSDSQGEGIPFLSAESLSSEAAQAEADGSVYTKTLRDSAKAGDVVGVSVSNMPNANDPTAPMFSCVSLAVVTQDRSI